MIETLKKNDDQLGQQLDIMPIEDPNYEWRIRIDLRCGVDMPLNLLKPSKMPSMMFEIAWSEGIQY